MIKEVLNFHPVSLGSCLTLITHLTDFGHRDLFADRGQI